jgi:alanine racemase
MMPLSRRHFLGSAATAVASFSPLARLAAQEMETDRSRAGQAPAPRQLGDRFDPWIEVLPDNLGHNVSTLRRLGGRPILAVVKNHGYGLDYRIVARLLESLEDVEGLAIVRAEEALILREQGVRKPILLMARAPDSMLGELAARRITLAVYADDDPRRLASIRANEPVSVQAYIDTGMSRMGIPYHRAMPFLRSLVATPRCRLAGTFMTFTEDAEFDREQLSRFLALRREAQAAGIALGRLHAASSHSIFHHRDVGFDLVRPGMSLYGGYPDKFDDERAMAELRPALRLRARVVRTDRLRPGDSVSYGRQYVAAKPVWIATIPLGHGDGYARAAVKGARVLVGDRLYPVIGAVSASHSIIEVGDEERVRIGDVATYLGPDRPEIHPNEVARVTGSVYDLLMHLNPSLPRVVVAS